MRLGTDTFPCTLCLLAVFGWFAHTGAKQDDVVPTADTLLLNPLTFMTYGLDGFAYTAETLVSVTAGARDHTALHMTVHMSTFWLVFGAGLFVTVYALAGADTIRVLTDQPTVCKTVRHHLVWAALLPIVSVWDLQPDSVFIDATCTHKLLVTMAVAAVTFWGSPVTL